MLCLYNEVSSTVGAQLALIFRWVPFWLPCILFNVTLKEFNEQRGEL